MAYGAVHLDELCELVARHCSPAVAIVVRLVTATLALGVAVVVVSGVTRAGRPFDRSAVGRALVVGIAAAASIAGGDIALRVVGIPEATTRIVTGTAGVIVVLASIAGLSPAIGRGRSAVEDGGAPHREPAIELGFHTKFTRE